MTSRSSAPCARLDCDYPAPSGPYCGLHTGMELKGRADALKSAAQAPKFGTHGRNTKGLNR